MLSLPFSCRAIHQYRYDRLRVWCCRNAAAEPKSGSDEENSVALAQSENFSRPPQAPQRVGGPLGWRSFEVPEFGTRIQVPASIFRPAGKPEQGSGQRFERADGRAVLSIYSRPNSRQAFTEIWPECLEQETTSGVRRASLSVPWLRQACNDTPRGGNDHAASYPGPYARAFSPAPPGLRAGALEHARDVHAEAPSRWISDGQIFYIIFFGRMSAS